MILIVGDTRSKELVHTLRIYGWGRMFIDKKFTVYQGEPWGFDNGAFRDWRKGKEFDANRYLKAVDSALKMAEESHYPYLSVLPDKVAKGIESLEFSDFWTDKLRKHIGSSQFKKLNWYVAVQDGMTVKDVEEFLKKHKEIKGIFLGGTDRFKAIAPDWSSLAKQLGLKFHYARAGTPKKYALAKLSGADSIDSAFPLWVKNRLDWFLRNCEKKIQAFEISKNSILIFNIFRIIQFTFTGKFSCNLKLKYYVKVVIALNLYLLF